MTGNQMLAMLGIRLGDPGERAFTSLLKLEALDRATLRVAELLAEPLIGSLEVYVPAQDLTAGKITFTTLEGANTILRKGPDEGIQRVRIKDGAHCARITKDDLPEVEDNDYLTASAAAPYYYVYGEAIYVLPATTAKIDVWLLKQPAAQAASDAEYSNINEAYHELIVDMGQAFLLNDSKAEERAIAEINAVNEGVV